MSAVPQLSLAITETEFQSTVTGYAELMHWKWCHFFPLQNKRGKYQTPVEGHPGMPDLVMSRDGAVLLVELKRAVRGVVSPQQKGWLAALGDHGRLWTPHDWNSGEIIRTLRHYGREPVAG